MLTLDQINALRDAAQKITDPVSEYLLQDITRRVVGAGQLTSTAAYQVWLSQQLGVSQREIKQELRKRLGLSHREIRRIMYQCAQSGYSLDVSRFPYVQALPFAQNASLQQIVSAAVELAQDDFTNLTQTLGMVDPFGQARPLQDAYRSCTDFAFKQVITGAASYTEAIRQATRNLAAQGVRVIDYQSGVHTSLEAAVRRNILGGLGLMQEQVSRVTHDQLGCDGWEISAHANSAPDHEPIQGRQYPDAEYEALNHSLLRRIGTLNCGHTAFPIILGVSRPQYSKEELEKFRMDNEKGVDIDGRHYTGYEATQMQRKLERAIRTQKRRVMVDEAAGDAEKLAQDKTRLNILHQRYTQFSKAAGLKTQYERTEVKVQPLLESDISDVARRTIKSAEQTWKAFKKGEKGLRKVVGFTGLPKDYQDSFRIGLAKAPLAVKTVLRKIYRKADYVILNSDRSYIRHGIGSGVITLGTKGNPSTLAHELFHWVDKGHKISQKLIDSLAKDHVALNVISDGDIKGYLIKKYPNAFEQRILTGELVFKEKYRGVSDILNGLSGGTIDYGYGHPKNYWQKPGALEAEAWAQFGRISFQNDDEVFDILKTLFPALTKRATMLLEGLM